MPAPKIHPLLDIRGWHKLKKRMYYLSESNAFRIKLGAGFGVLFDRQPEPKRMYKLMFYTGITDAKRKKIYTGDILGDRLGHAWKVFFDSGRFQATNQEWGQTVDLHTLHPKRFDLKVIGNIFEGCE